MTEKARVFVSYAAADRDWADEFAEQLVKHDVDVWLDETDVASRQDWAEAVETALRETETIVALLSPASVKTPSVLFDLGVAIGAGKRLVPIFLSAVAEQDIPYMAKGKQAFSEDSPERAAGMLALALRG